MTTGAPRHVVAASRGLGRTLVLAALLGACAGPIATLEPDGAALPDEPVLQAFETLDEARGPWRTDPIGLDPILEARIVDGCRRELLGPRGMQRAMPPAEGAVVDARGEGLALVALVFPNGGDAGCLPVTVDHGGGTGLAPSAWGRENDPLPEPPPRELYVDTQGEVFVTGRPPGRAVVGHVGDAIRRVIVEPPEGEPVVASVGHGRFMAWWPEEGIDGTNSSVGNFRVVGTDAEGREIFSCRYGAGSSCFDVPGFR
jgi:hypothetical protein